MTFPALEAALAGANNLIDDNATVTVCLAARGPAGGAPMLHRLQLSDALADAFLTTAADKLRDLHRFVDAGDMTLEAYDAAEPHIKHEIEVHVPPPASVQAAVVTALGTLQQLPVFDGAAKTINRLVFHVIAIQRSGQPNIYLFRKYSKSKELGRSKKLVTLFSDGAFDQIKQPVFLFDDMVDAIWIGGHMAILNKDSFHRIFQFFTEVLQHAQTTLTQIQAAIPITNAAQFEADCKGNALILVKLRGIAQRNYLAGLTLDALAAKIAAHNLPITISGTGADRRLVYDPKNKWKFLRLIDDAFLHSDMTGANYEVTGKRTI